MKGTWLRGTTMLACVIAACHGLYFHIAEGERKCFIEEVPEETLVVGHYKCQLHDPNTGGFMPSSPGIGMHVEVRDPEEKIILSKVPMFYILHILFYIYPSYC